LNENERGDLMTGSIVCGVDDSASAKGAARVARGLGLQLGLRVVFVRVVGDRSSDGEISGVTARLHHLTENVTEVDCGAHWVVEVGDPADRLVAVAEKEGASLIVVGATGPRASLLGNISADVSRRAPCPVVVVAPGADRSLGNGNGDAPVSAWKGFLEAGVTGRSELAPGQRPAAKNRTRHGSDNGGFAGGIVRFSLGGRYEVR
jgi:nucleotide-binding universal stress UspA family protein